MLTEKVVEEFKARGKVARLRYPKFEDVDGLLTHINSLVEERAFIGTQKKVSRKEELGYVRRLLKDIERKRAVALIVEIDRKILGAGEVKKAELDASRHTGNLGVALRKEARGLGIGERLAKSLIREAKKRLNLKIAKLEVFANNKPAYKLYKKLGFKEVGRIENGNYYYGKYVDNIIMVKYL